MYYPRRAMGDVRVPCHEYGHKAICNTTQVESEARLRAKPIIHALTSVFLLLLLCLSSLVHKRCHHGEVVHDTPRVLTRQTSTLRMPFAFSSALRPPIRRARWRR
jgi:hypothetical protein